MQMKGGGTMLIAILEDNAFRKITKEPYSKRWTVRCFVYDANNNLVFLRIRGADNFGMRNHLETIGGGVEENESLEDSVHREVLEEIGYRCEIIEKIGYVVDHYNLINRETISTFFAVRLLDYVGENQTKEEKDLFAGLETYAEEEVFLALDQCRKRSVDELVQRRDKIAYMHYMQKQRNK